MNVLTVPQYQLGESNDQVVGSLYFSRILWVCKRLKFPKLKAPSVCAWPEAVRIQQYWFNSNASWDGIIGRKHIAPSLTFIMLKDKHFFQQFPLNAACGDSPQVTRLRRLNAFPSPDPSAVSSLYDPINVESRVLCWTLSDFLTAADGFLHSLLDRVNRVLSELDHAEHIHIFFPECPLKGEHTEDGLFRPLVWWAGFIQTDLRAKDVVLTLGEEEDI